MWLFLLLYLLADTPVSGYRLGRSSHFPMRMAAILPPSDQLRQQCADLKLLNVSQATRAQLAERNTRCSYEKYLITIDSVLPALKLAIEDARDRYFPGQEWAVLNTYKYGECSDQLSTAHASLDAFINLKPDIVFGPFCDYALATICRIMTYSKVLVSAPGGMSNAFDRKDMYPGLTRVGVYFSSIRRFLEHFFKSDQVGQWSNFIYLYEHGFTTNEVLSKTFCKLFGNNLIDEWGKKKSATDPNKKFNMTAGPFFPAGINTSQAAEFLKTNVGLQFSVHSDEILTWARSIIAAYTSYAVTLSRTCKMCAEAGLF